MADYGLGRIGAPDERDRLHAIAPRMAAVEEPQLPRSRYCWTPPTTFPLDQNGYPECVGYTHRGLLYAGPQVNMGGPSARTIYVQAQMRDEWPGENYAGTSARGAMKYLHEQGYISEYVWAWTVADIRLWHLATGKPGALGVNWYSSFFSPGKDGYIRITPTASVAGGHEVLSLGWDDRRGALRCMNSWGAWGQNGRFWIPGEVLDRLMHEDGDYVSPTEIKVSQ